VGVFLSRLANLSRIVNVTNLQLEGSQQKSRNKNRRARASEGNSPAGDMHNSDRTMTASFIATAYSLRDPSAPVEQAPPAEAGGRRQQNASVGHGAPSKATSGATTKRVSDKAKKKPVEGEQ
jgi:Tfp pilus assembly protein PilO